MRFSHSSDHGASVRSNARKRTMFGRRKQSRIQPRVGCLRPVWRRNFGQRPPGGGNYKREWQHTCVRTWRIRCKHARKRDRTIRPTPSTSSRKYICTLVLKYTCTTPANDDIIFLSIIHQATDADVTHTLTYLIRSVNPAPNPSNLWTIDSNTGIITATQPVDFEAIAPDDR